MKPRTRRTLTGLLLSLTAVIIGIIIASYLLLWLSVPPTEGTIALPGLQDEVEITFDKMGVPQVWARTESDGYFALGFHRRRG